MPSMISFNVELPDVGLIHENCKSRYGVYAKYFLKKILFATCYSRITEAILIQPYFYIIYHVRQELRTVSIIVLFALGKGRPTLGLLDRSLHFFRE